MVAETASAMVEAASMVVVVAVVTMPARISREWPHLGRRQLRRAPASFGSARLRLAQRGFVWLTPQKIKSEILTTTSLRQEVETQER
jgi:hypothetical protein